MCDERRTVYHSALEREDFEGVGRAAFKYPRGRESA